MEIFVSSLHALSPLAAGVLIASVWQGTLLTAGVALLLRVLRSVSPSVRTLVWTAVLLLLVLLPVLAISVPHRATGHAELHVAQDWSVALLAIWLTFSVLRAAALGANAMKLWGLARRATPVSAPAGIAAMMGGPRRAELCVSDEVNRPSVAGFLRPRVLLPAGLLETLSETELEHVVLHEMEHLRRGDDWLNLFQQISLVLLPLNPALVWLDRRLCRERELACDDGVLRATHANKAYAACLVKLAEDSLVRKGFALALSALGTRARESELVGRVRRILAGPERTFAPGRMRLAVGSLAALMVLGTGVLARSPEVVSFDGNSAGQAVARASEPLVSAPQGSFAPVSIVAERGFARPVMAKAVVGGSGADKAVTGRAHAVMAVAVQRRKAVVRALRTRAVIEPGTAWRMADTRTLVEKASAETQEVPASALRPTVADGVVPAGRVVVTEFEVSQPVFAAVAVQGGWLIVQL